MASNFYKKLDGWPAAVIGAVVLIAIAYYGVITYRSLSEEKALILAELEDSRLGQRELLLAVREREDIIESFQGQIGKISSTVGTLEKLSQTDEELLKKYSKVYFLNENYTPTRLKEIESTYLNKGATNKEVHAQVWPYLERLLIEADKAGQHLLIASAFRSFGTQSALKSSYTSVYGTGANKFSADQGYSEHQLGTAIDFTTVKLGAGFSAFAGEDGYQWLRDHAHDYGFTLSYPEGNSYYKFEPWHWRFVGVALATKLYDEKKHFYDLDQREIDTYLIKLFD